MLEELKIEMEDRLDSVEKDIKKLMVKTNYESQRYFKFMNDSIKKNDKSIEETNIKLGKVHELYDMMEEYPTLSLTKCIEGKLFPPMEAKIEIKT